MRKFVVAAAGAILLVASVAGAIGSPTSTLPPNPTTTLFPPFPSSTIPFQPCESPPGAQFMVSDLRDGVTPTQLAQSLVGSGVVVTNVSYVGADISAGSFIDASNVAGIGQGVILGSGCNKGVAGPNDQDGYTADLMLVGDADLDALIPGYTTFDATVLEFDFVPETDTVQIRYVFASEEYNEFVNSNYNDVFGFYVNGVNRALLPDLTTVVSINNVNGGNPFGSMATNPAFYRNNDCDDPACPLDIQADGMTAVLAVVATVTPGQTNHFKIAVADAGDHVLDSWILLVAGSFSSTENCENMIDDDGDELIDNQDPDCFRCGDGDIDPGEECDDGNIAEGDGCGPLCTLEIECGNGEIERGEECDDGNTASGDGCDAECQLESVCGDGVVDGLEECDDANTAAGDGCDGSCAVEQCWICMEGYPTKRSSTCMPNDAGDCDDGDPCIVGEHCMGGACIGGDPVVFGAACHWFVVGESDTAAGVSLKEGAGTDIEGDICLDKAKVGLSSFIVGDLAVTKASGAKGIVFAPSVTITGDIVTGGAGVRGIQGATLPHLTPLVASVAAGTTATKDDPPGGVYDTTGTSAVLADCDAAMTAVDSADAALSVLPIDQTNGRVRVAGGGTLPLAPSNPGGINVIAFERLLGGLGSVLELSGGGDPDTVMIVRVDGKLSLRGQCEVRLVDGLQIRNTILYGRGRKVQLGSFCQTSGTIYSLGKVKLGNGVTVQGQIFAGRQKIKLGDELTGTVTPNLVVLP